jgi:hypothetical protein
MFGSISLSLSDIRRRGCGPCTAAAPGSGAEYRTITTTSGAHRFVPGFFDCADPRGINLSAGDSRSREMDEEASKPDRRGSLVL